MLSCSSSLPLLVVSQDLTIVLVEAPIRASRNDLLLQSSQFYLDPIQNALYNFRLGEKNRVSIAVRDGRPNFRKVRAQGSKSRHID